MKVLHIAQILQGGTASHMSELIGLQNRSLGPASVGVLAPADQASYLDGLEPGQLHSFASSARNPRSLWVFARAARKVIRGFDPDIVHLHGTFAGLVVRALAWVDSGCRRPTVYCSHGWSFNMRVSRMFRSLFAFVERTLAPRTEAIVCISRYEYETARACGLPASRMTVVHNGIADCDAEPVSAEPERRGLRLLFVGRDCPQKAFDVAVEAMALLVEFPITLEAVGPEPREGLPANVTALGWLDRCEVPARLARSHALLMPSRWEGFGLAALEAMRQGRAVIASRVDALPELVVDGGTGILVPPDDPVALARVLKALNKESLRRMGRKGRESYLSRFTAQLMHDRIDAVYRRVLRR
ncbi:MAG TPA: glycosyltransferase family 4 protein [Novosphingobium sp.]|nr:glycosyltransferase family 4 protein [Novosphingobium sp.]